MSQQWSVTGRQVTQNKQARDKRSSTGKVQTQARGPKWHDRQPRKHNELAGKMRNLQSGKERVDIAD